MTVKSPSQFKAELGLDPKSTCQPVPLLLDKTLLNLLTSGVSSLCTSTFQTPLVLHFLLCRSRPSSKQTAQLAEFLPGPGASHPPSSCAVPSTPSTCSGKAEVQALLPPAVFVAPGDEEEEGCVSSCHEN